jgi:hypothetical protein
MPKVTPTMVLMVRVQSHTQIRLDRGLMIIMHSHMPMTVPTDQVRWPIPMQQVKLQMTITRRAMLMMVLTVRERLRTQIPLGKPLTTIMHNPMLTMEQMDQER